MRVSKIKIRNVLGVDSLEFSPRPGGVTVIRGPNESGKTSVLSAIQAVVGGGHDATLLRNGAEEGEVVLVLDDGTEIRKRITPTGSDLKVTDPTRGKIGAGKTFLESIVDPDGFNPVRFVDAGKEERLRMLLRAVPLRLEDGAVYAALSSLGLSGDALLRLASDDKEEHALVALDRARRTLYDLRTGVNRLARDKKSTAAELEKALPPKEENGIELAAAEPDLKNAQRQLESEKGEIRIRADATRDKLRQACDEEIAKAWPIAREKRKAACAARDAALLRIDEEIARLRRERSDTMASWEVADRTAADEEAAAARVAREKRDAAISVVTASERQSLEERDRTLGAEIRRLELQIAGLRERMRESERAAATRKLHLAAAVQCAALELEAEQLTKALAKIEVLRGKVLQDLPIEGLQVVEGDVMVGGVPFDRLSEARKVEVALAVAERCAGELGLVVVDGLERLDERRFATFRERAETSGLQLIVTRVDDEVFRVEA